MATDWIGELDPAEKLDFICDFQGAEDPVLETGETIASFSLAVTAAAAALGLTIETEVPYAPELVNTATAIRVWLSVAPAERSNLAFDAGVKLGVVATIITSSSPARTRERTWKAEVKQL